MMQFLKKYTTFLVIAVILVFAIGVRLVGITHTPPSLYWEEVALGYDAYSILKTGKDHHGNPWPIVAFESFGDWKPALYFYALVPFISFFGLEPWVIRLPSAISGILIVLGVGLLSYKTAQLLEYKNARFFGLIALFLSAISSWAIHFSRGGWEVNLATCLVTWAMISGLYALKKQKKKIKLSTALVLFSSILLSLAVYAYHGTRLLSPLLGVMVAIYWLIELYKNKQLTLHKIAPIIASGVLAFVLILPILLSLRSPQVSQRFAETSILSQLSVIEKSNQFREQSGNTLLSRALFHRYVLFGKEVANNYFDHFNLNFLFISGDINPRHSTNYGGHLYYQDFLFLVFGIGLLISRKKKISWILIGWWLLTIFPAALTKATPHALRVLPTMPAILTIISIGVGQSIILLTRKINNFSKLKFNFFPVSSLVIITYLVTFSFWWRHYWKIYPLQQADEWQYGYQQMVSEINMAKELNNAPIYITREQGRPAMFYWFFSKTKPSAVQSENSSAKKDQGEYLTFENISFVNTINEIAFDQPKIIVASSDQQMKTLEAQGRTIDKQATISNPLDEVVWQVYIVTNQ